MTLFLLETFVDAEQYRGTCYGAANWIEVENIQGRGRQDVQHNRPSSVKRFVVYALDAQAKQWLCQAELQLLIQPRPRPPADWAEEEFGNAQLGERIRKRLLT